MILCVVNHWERWAKRKPERIVPSPALLCAENHSLGEWFGKRLVSIMKK